MTKDDISENKKEIFDNNIFSILFNIIRYRTIEIFSILKKI